MGGHQQVGVPGRGVGDGAAVLRSISYTTSWDANSLKRSKSIQVPSAPPFQIGPWMAWNFVCPYPDESPGRSDTFANGITRDGA